MTPRDKTLALGGGIAIVILTLAGVVGYALTGRDASLLVPLLLGISAPIVQNLVSYAKLGSAVEGLQSGQDTISKQTNGALTNLQEHNVRLTDQLANSVPATTMPALPFVVTALPADAVTSPTPAGLVLPTPATPTTPVEPPKQGS